MRDGSPQLERDAVQACQEALRRVCVLLPHLAGLAHQVRPRAEWRIETIGVFASGRLAVHPEFILALAPADRVFVLAHELLHLALDTHGRGRGSDARAVNLAHDYIINDILEATLGQPTPAGGLWWFGARHTALEVVLADIRSRQSRFWARSWQPYPPRGTLGKAWYDQALDDALHRNQSPPPFRAFRDLRETLSWYAEADQAALPPPLRDDLAGLDVLTAAQEREWYPETRSHEIARQREQVRAAAIKANSLRRLFAALDRMEARGRNEPDDESGDACATVTALQHAYRPPWELALQRWFDAHAAGQRSFARPSRRGAERSDVVRPGRRREGWALHLVLDTSGSMEEDLPGVLGAIAAFGAGAAVSVVHVLQCDVEVTADDWLEPEELEQYPIHGFGGSDLSPALARLADDPAVEAVVVVTDGAITYPVDPPPFSVLWAVVGSDVSWFRPPYGQVITLPNRLEG